MELTGAQALIECLKKEGVDVVFGYPGGTVLPIYDVLYNEKKLRHILTRHEQGAAHAADGYARATGKVGVCLATSGPGATNLITGIANANMDSIPMVAITGQVGTPLLGKDSFQEADITGITMPITKHNYLIKDPEEIPRVIKEAFHIARTGRPGPVVVDIAKDAQMKTLKNFKYPETVDIPSYKPTLVGHPKQINAAVKLIEAAQKPLLYVGGGVIAASAYKELKEFAEKNNIPVTVTLMGKGAFPGDSKLYLGMLGMHGTAYANYAVQDADLLIAVGARFDDRVTGHLPSFAPNAKHIHIDVDPAEIGKNIRIDVPIVGDAKNILKEFLAKVSCKDRHEAWLAQIAEWKKKYPLSYKEGKKIKPQYVIERTYELTKDKKVIIATEVGQHQMWTAQFFTFKKPRTLVTSGGLGTMGYGFPAAIGAQVGCPDAIVIDIAGDGSIQMNIQELTTAVCNRLPVKIFVLNNSFLGMVRQWQEIIYDRRYSSTNLCANPDLVKIAKAFGAEAFRVTKPTEVDRAIKDALKVKDRPVLVDFVVEKEENVFPFVLAGKPLNEMLVD
ncbi:acetolactate synthase, large subunit, biosynthetic type [candidate division WOR-1 bacterium RIFOXYA12_FULL_43_27]|uniref:Acetolactate synthase n=1 Tax=candidate division WOR-1 bacterium RIFOXYC2_FULL_46_14 TaxID=1802587 RepID=A0A1F4U4P6_UNCSA|nr:MAG: acetolactate synthase, large subunit, biosynthetic type [candidate division WOR-1 bacterium RIFOXYA12_FULL_43_27]OGC20878.1 MAG: acetolactate synthase, large subunit, biosynthetic type [candidate division WOR-1 bacterium RIFOXYB2_FULL_46_45]OGC31384.1 MAG: acetolactate synthase, large subunit, biosynthetic type [candidate division WOR-1 bacterium RIFOXYA2_FULL_46_56]OGC39790.1 MAG: acetolactate synthase, large subunit, biosynthetic type [candidate division WOR-1 bacterium RIFOXYC2_FULL_4